MKQAIQRPSVLFQTCLICLQRLYKRQCHRVANDRDNIDLLFPDELPSMCGIKVGLIRKNNFMSRKQSDQCRPQCGTMHQGSKRHRHQQHSFRDSSRQLFRLTYRTISVKKPTTAKRRKKQMFVRPHDALGIDRRASGKYDD